MYVFFLHVTVWWDNCIDNDISLFKKKKQYSANLDTVAYAKTDYSKSFSNDRIMYIIINPGLIILYICVFRSVI